MRSQGGVRLGNPQISKNDHTLMHSDEKQHPELEIQKNLTRILHNTDQKLVEREKK